MPMHCSPFSSPAGPIPDWFVFKPDFYLIVGSSFLAQALGTISQTLTTSTDITGKWTFPEPGSFLEDAGAVSPTGDLSFCALFPQPGTKLDSGILPYLSNLITTLAMSPERQSP